MSDRCVVIGAGGHAKTAVDILVRNGVQIAGVTDVPDRAGTSFQGYPILGGDDRLADIYASGVHAAAMGIGHVGNPQIRNAIYERVGETGFLFLNLVHPSAVLAETVCCGDGNLFAANSVVNAGARIGSLCIVNTAAVIEHDADIADGVHIAPHAVVLGEAAIGRNTFVGAGSVVLQGVSIGSNCLVGAGSVVLHDVEDDCVVIGNPGRILRRRQPWEYISLPKPE